MSRATEAGRRLREAREQAGLTQPELAMRAGVSVTSVRNLETGRYDHPHSATVERVAQALGLAIDSLDDRAADDFYARLSPDAQVALFALGGWLMAMEPERRIGAIRQVMDIVLGRSED